MSQPQYEPYLRHRCIVFNGMLTIMDPVYSTSEIKPIMLSIPKNVKGMLQNLNKSVTPAVRLPQPEGGGSPKTRLLSSSIRQSAAQGNQASSPKQTERPNPPPEQPATNQRNSPKRESQMPKIQINPLIEQFIQEDPDFWMHPFPTKCTGEFIVEVEKSKSKYRFSLYLDISKPPLLQAILNGLSVNDQLKLSTSDKYSIMTSYDSINRIYYAGLSEAGQNPNEICAIQFLGEGEFNLFIPALKKNKTTGKGMMCPTHYNNDNSTIYSKFEQKSKEVIRLLSRASDNKNGDFTYEGRFADNSKANFILYHESNKKKDILSCGKVSGTSALNLCGTYPLNLIQSFFAVIAANVSH